MNLHTQTLHLLQQTTEYIANHHQQAYLVGGSLRNILLETPGIDWDIAITGDAPSLARQLANKFGGHYAHFHDKAHRVIVPLTSTSTQDKQTPNPHKEFILDIAHLKGDIIEQDLRKRDFTINAIAAPLANVSQHLQTGEALHLIDPLHGLADLQAHRLKAVDSDVFRHDPLRMLRAVRFMARYHLSIDPWTEGLLIRDSSLLLQVAPERIHDELYAILEPRGATDQLHFLDAHGLLTTLMPEFIPARGMLQPRPHYWDVLEHSLQTVGTLEQLSTLLQQTPDAIQQSPLESQAHGYLAHIQQLLQEAEQQHIFSRATLTTPRMKLAALLHDIGKPPTYSEDAEGHIHFYAHPQVGVPLAQQVMKRIHASNADRRLVQQIVAHHMRPGQLAHLDAISPRAIRRYFVDLGTTGIIVALLSLADHLATTGPLFGTSENNADTTISSWEQHLATVHLFLNQYIQHRENILPPQLISADELMRRLNLKPGPHIGRLLEAIAEAQAEGAISSRDEAFWLAEEKLNQLNTS